MDDHVGSKSGSWGTRNDEAESWGDSVCFAAPPPAAYHEFTVHQQSHSEHRGRNNRLQDAAPMNLVAAPTTVAGWCEKSILDTASAFRPWVEETSGAAVGAGGGAAVGEVPCAGCGGSWKDEENEAMAKAQIGALLAGSDGIQRFGNVLRAETINIKISDNLQMSVTNWFGLLERHTLELHPRRPNRNWVEVDWANYVRSFDFPPLLLRPSSVGASECHAGGYCSLNAWQA